jgi:hypothetical protein
VEVIARLATYTVGTNPALADMTFTYLGTATTPDRWTATPTAEWALVTDIRRFGARAIKCTVVAGTAGNRYIVPFRKVAGDDIQVSKNTKYTFSAFVKTEGALTGGNLRLAVSRTGSDTDFITPDVASPIVTNTSAFPDGWQRITMTFTTEAIETVRPMLLYTRNSGVNEAFYTDAWKIEEGTVATAWTPGFIGTPVVLDANGIQVDGSAGGILRLRGILGGARDTVELGQNGLLIGGDVEVFSDLANELRLGAGDSLYVPSEVRLGSTKDVAWTRGAANRMDLAAGDTLRLQTDGNGLDFVNGRIRGAGTSFPGSPATDDLYYRTDRDMWYGYDGTRWLSQEYQVQMMATVAFPIAATSLVGRWTPAGLVGAGGAADIWLVSFDITFFVNAGGTALGASHKWDGTLDKVPDGSGTPTVISTASSIASGASAVWRHTGPHAIGALLNNGTTHVTIQFTETKTGTPGALHVGPILTYRLVG